jgi:hypothetical protein
MFLPLMRAFGPRLLEDRMTADISECGQYRYTLTRKTKCPLRWVRPALFIMLNPSTADATKDDPTIRRCISFAEREGCTDLTVVNLFALRATDPRELPKHADPVGPLNDRRIREAIEAHEKFGIIVAAWGANKFAQERGTLVKFLWSPNLLCLGKNKDGSPKHPLYVKNDAPLIVL